MCLLLILSNKLDLNQETRFTILSLVTLSVTALGINTLTMTVLSKMTLSMTPLS